MQERPNFLFCHLVKISPQKVVLNSHLEESERQRTLSAVEVEGVGLGEGGPKERKGVHWACGEKRSNLTRRGLGVIMGTALSINLPLDRV